MTVMMKRSAKPRERWICFFPASFLLRIGIFHLFTPSPFLDEQGVDCENWLVLVRMVGFLSFYRQGYQVVRGVVRSEIFSFFFFDSS